MYNFVCKFKNLLTFKQLLSIIIHLVLKLIIFIVISIILYKTIKNTIYQSAVNKICFKINNISQIETSQLTQETIHQLVLNTSKSKKFKREFIKRKNSRTRLGVSREKTVSTMYHKLCFPCTNRCGISVFTGILEVGIPLWILQWKTKRGSLIAMIMSENRSRPLSNTGIYLTCLPACTPRSVSFISSTVFFLSSTYSMLTSGCQLAEKGLRNSDEGNKTLSPA